VASFSSFWFASTLLCCLPRGDPCCFGGENKFHPKRRTSVQEEKLDDDVAAKPESTQEPRSSKGNNEPLEQTNNVDDATEALQKNNSELPPEYDFDDEAEPLTKQEVSEEPSV
jgi:hypothetical protein